VSVLEKFYSGTFGHFAAPFPDILQRPPPLKSHASHNI
jgi:hypothetical protein